MYTFTRSNIPYLIYIYINTIAVLSNEPVNILSPSELKCKLTISPSCPSNLATYFPVSTSHNLAVLSIDPVPTNNECGSNEMQTISN